jgi:foldase protein PrsA
MQEEQLEKTAKSTSSNGRLFLYGIIAIVVLALIIIGGIAVKATNSLSQNPFVLKVASVMNVPAAKINGMKISYRDYIDDLQTLEKFYANTPDVPTPTEEQISDQVLSRLIANELIGEIADEYDVELEEEDLGEFKTNLLAQFEDEEAAETELMEKYGWSLDKYMEKVVTPILIEQKLQEAFSLAETEEDDSKYLQEQVSAQHILFAAADEIEKETAKVKAQAVLDELKNGADFVELAAEHSADTANKDNGGNLGFFGKGVMVPEFEKAVFALEDGELAEELVETAYGFHIIKLGEKKQVKDYFAFMDDQFKNADIKVLIPVHNPFEQLKQDQVEIDNIGDEEIQE